MCGICGKFSPEGVHADDLAEMLRSIAHRGPDDEGVYVDGPVALGHRRLSIIDPARGHQPLSNEDGTIWITFSGQIYNFRELRPDLESRGHVFRTDTDTEVIVHLYEELGERFVERLRGMFALAIWDGRRRKLLLARDRLGEKPLFYAQHGETLLFASEVKAILAAWPRARELDRESLHHYLSLRFVPSPATMFRGVSKLPPGHLLVFESGQVRVSRYWQLSFSGKTSLAPRQIESQLGEMLTGTVASQLVSDVPVGALLSGGMDSSVVVALASRQVEGLLPTFSIGVHESDFDELPFARMVADRFATRHIEQRAGIDVLRLLPTMVWHLDEPSDPVAACQFAAAGLASRHVKVVLGGDGGDELFAGFDRYRGIPRVAAYASVPQVLRNLLIAPLVRRAPDTFAYKNVVQKLRWLDGLSRLQTTAERYAAATTFFRFSHADKQALFTPELWREVGRLDSASAIVDRFHESGSDDPLDCMLYTDYVTRLPEHSLMLTDRMAMAHGLELRSPFLDHELVEFMATVPSHLKIAGGELKAILRRVAAPYLPRAITRRAKQGFMLPVAYWFREALHPFLVRFWERARIVDEGLVRADEVGRMVNAHRRGRVDHHDRLWMLLNLEVWHRLYLDGASVASVTEDVAALLEPSRRFVAVPAELSA